MALLKECGMWNGSRAINIEPLTGFPPIYLYKTLNISHNELLDSWFVESTN
jgi:hypothetical protein